MTQSTNLLFEKEVSTSVLRTESVFGEEGVMASMFDDYTPRAGQLNSIPLIWDAMKSNKHCLIEGPCGFGKTFAYLFPTMMQVVEENKRAIIATSGITLQDQLYKKDAPFMAEVIKKYTGHEVSIGYLKGRQNYICNRKIAEVIYNKANGVLTTDKDIDKLIEFYENTTTGDKDELDYVPDSKLWNELACNKDDCEGKNCSFKHECFYHTAKAKAQDKSIIITNYHILLADKDINGMLLGTYDILVCDEAHELPNITRDYYESKFGMGTLSDLKRKTTLLRKYGDIVDLNLIHGQLEAALTPCTKYIEGISGLLSYMKPGDMALVEGNIEGKLYGWSDSKNALDGFHEFLENYILEIEGKDEDTRTACNLLSNLSSSARNASLSLEAVAGGYIREGELDNIVRFIEMNKHRKVELKLKLKKIGDLFEDMFISNQDREERPLSMLLTSATISVDNNFNYIKDQLGIKDKYNTLEFIGESPFNLSNQELWYLPPNAKNGNEQDFLNRMLQNLLEVSVSCNGGVLGLFTSIYNMKAASKFLHDNMPKGCNIEILTQGDMPREKLINCFKKDKNSILIGTKSLFTGVDVPGDALRCVFIDKLPFPSLGDPVQQALNKEPGAFFKYSIPNMIIDLKQAVGRGIRSVDDKCVIVIADNRMSTANYKQKIFSSFNYEKSGTRNIDAVIDFVERR